MFVFGLLVPRAPLSAAVAGLLVGPLTYGILNWQLPDVAFLNHMAFTFLTVVAVMVGFTVARPRAELVTYPVQNKATGNPQSIGVVRHNTQVQV